MDRASSVTNERDNPKTQSVTEQPHKDSNERDASLRNILPFFRLLMREPPREHDFKTCPTCKRYGIDRI